MNLVGIGSDNGLSPIRRQAIIWTNAGFKGSNMIVCVLLVSNSRGCCLAAPGDHEGAAREIAPAARQHPREFDTNNTHTIMFDPDYNMMPPIFQMHTVLSIENGKFYTTMIYPYFSRSVCFRWDRLLDEGLAFVQAGVPSRPDDVTLRSCANLKCDVADVNE